MESRTPRVLVATDLSSVSEPLVASAAGLARQMGAELVAIHVFEPQEYEEVRRETRMSLDQYTDQLRSRMRQ
ncbi:MAG: universal stress protein, partial [Armatimonadetes bacterium]|nr:universal stress protein [Armatimonadota bacterium]